MNVDAVRADNDDVVCIVIGPRDPPIDHVTAVVARDKNFEERGGVDSLSVRTKRDLSRFGETARDPVMLNETNSSKPRQR